MGRLLNWPRGLGIIAWSPLAGPRAEGATGSESLTGFIQTVASAFGRWSYQLTIAGIAGRRFRLYRQMIVAAHGGANAIRIPFNDPDVMTFRESGIAIDNVDARKGVPWSNTMPWSNGCNWQLSRPPVSVSADAAKDSVIITLANEHWGRTIEAGRIGFFPFHFGVYEITQVIGDGQYKIWPPLRKAIVASQTWATLNPVLAGRLKGESAGTANRGRAVAENNTITIVEVTDDEVRKNFTD